MMRLPVAQGLAWVTVCAGGIQAQQGDPLARHARRVADTSPWPHARTLSGIPLPHLQRHGAAAAVTWERVRRTDILVGRPPGSPGAWTLLLVDGSDGAATLLCVPGAAAWPAAVATGADAAAIPLATDAPGGLRWTGSGIDIAAWPMAEQALAERLALWDGIWAGATRCTTDEDVVGPAIDEFAVALLRRQDLRTGLLIGDASTASALAQVGGVRGLLALGMHTRARAALHGWGQRVRDRGLVEAGWPLTATAAAPAGTASPTTAAWFVLTHYWYLRSSQDTALVREHWPLLEACVKQMPRQDEVLVPHTGDDGGYWRFDAALLFVHAVACIGGMQDAIDRIENPARWADDPRAPRPGAAWNARFLELVTALEHRFWAAETTRFHPARARRDDAPWPHGDAASNLLPAWCGMLTTSGDRTLANLATALAMPAGAPPPWATWPDPLVAASRSHAAVLLDDPRRFDAVPALIAGARQACADGSEPWCLGLALDALLHACTGLRVGTGPGIDEDWLRLRPALPPGCRTLAVTGLRHDGWQADLWLEARDGPLDAAERESNAGRPAPQRVDPQTAPPRTRFLLVQRSPDPPHGPRLGVIHCAGAQFQERLRRDVPWADSAFHTGSAGR